MQAISNTAPLAEDNEAITQNSISHYPLADRTRSSPKSWVDVVGVFLEALGLEQTNYALRMENSLDVKRHPDILPPDQVQLRLSNSEMRERISKFIAHKREQVDASNRTEFLRRADPSGEDITCARTDAREINRNIQMKFDIVNNEDGPLARSLVGNMSGANGAGRSDMPKQNDDAGAGTDVRLRNLEAHLAVEYVPSKGNVNQRITALETRIMQLERDYPVWAALHFDQPGRQFPPPPIKAIFHIHSDNSVTREPSMTSRNQPNKLPSPSSPTSHVTSTNPPPLKATGRANSSLTRAIMEQLARKQQGSSDG
ncbi:hypothetical protein BZG36_01615 [Bifiguratus adelaidae]|uniref:MAP3K12-binding inhibitory protein 1 n=1 Tax=Bifiguratus adelaidae TaxID=1938954 RepID=A0A261Y477_9FUNG|nr:hypothetical protein BZG36_01615 [Bifiguratus adelaidae]